MFKLVFSVLAFFFLATIASAQSLEEYRLLSERLGSYPQTLVSQEGEAFHFAVKGFQEGDRVIKFVDHLSNPVPFPDRIVINDIPGHPGQYFILMRQGEEISWHRATLSDGVLALSSPITGQQPLSPPIPLYDGTAFFAKLDEDDRSYLTFVSFVQDSKEPKAEAGRTVHFEQSMRLLGPVVHPVSGIAGYALSPRLARNVAELYFPNGETISLEFPEALSVFAVDAKRLVVGSNRKKCEPSEGFPAGLCTPDLFVVDIPESDRAYSLEDRRGFKWIATSFPDFTYGFVDPLRHPSDFKIVGDRLLIVAYRGPKQMVIEYDMLDYGPPVVRVPLRDGVDIDFGVASGPPGSETAVINERSYVVPRATMLVRMGQSEFEEFIEFQPYEAMAQHNLTLKTFEGRSELMPVTVVAPYDEDNRNFCSSGKALVEVYGGTSIFLKPYNLIGFEPTLFRDGGAYIAAHVQGSGGYGSLWSRAGLHSNAASQADELAKLLSELQGLGCEDIYLLGSSYGGTLVLQTAFKYPSLVDGVIAVVAPLDLEKEHQRDNRAISALLPRDWASLALDDFRRVSPRHIADDVDDLSGLSVTLITGKLDDRVTTGEDSEAIAAFRAKGANVRLIAREGIGHQKFNSKDSWAEFHFAIGEALNGR